MSIKSSRQFRSYVISWFLMIVGLIAIIVGNLIYRNAEDFLFTKFRQAQYNQLTAMAQLIDEVQHSRINQFSALKTPYYQQLQQVFAANSDNLFYTLTSDSQKQQVSYAVDPRKAKQDIIQVYNQQIQINLVMSADRQVKLLVNQQLLEHYDQPHGQQNYYIRLQHQAEQSVLLVNDKIVLNVFRQPTFSASIQQVSLTAQNLSPQTAEISDDVNWHFNYQFIPQGETLNIPGKAASLPLNLKSILINKNVTKNAASLSSDVGDITQALTIYAPLNTSQGNTQGWIILEVSEKTLSQMREEFLQSILLGFSLLGIALMIASIFFARKITGPLEQLTIAIERLIRNDFNFKLSAKRFGSAGYIADQFNLMLTRIQRSRNELLQTNKSFSRFVPHQLLKQLSSSGVADISLGDCCEREMTVLFCDIRGFTTLSESMSPQANFLFINRYLSQIAPVINKHGGIIDKYLGDGIMALFPNSADHAVTAAIEMLTALDKYNRHLEQKQLPGIQVGIGLHSGKMMLGTVGTASRMDATVVSDTVNAAARVESMTKAFATKILITEETKRQLEDIAAYKIRFIASCLIQGKSKPVTLYEIYDNDSGSLRKEKSANQNGMINAWKKYQQGDPITAIQMYQNMIEKSPYDKSLFALIECCQKGRL